MPSPLEFQSRRGTVAVTFTQTGTYSTWADLGGMKLVGIFSPAWPALAAGSVTFRTTLGAASGTGYPVLTEAGAPFRVNPFGSDAFYSFTPGTQINLQQLMLQVGTAGTASVAGGGTIVLICAVD